MYFFLIQKQTDLGTLLLTYCVLLRVVKPQKHGTLHELVGHRQNATLFQFGDALLFHLRGHEHRQQDHARHGVAQTGGAGPRVLDQGSHDPYVHAQHL